MQLFDNGLITVEPISDGWDECMELVQEEGKMSYLKFSKEGEVTLRFRINYHGRDYIFDGIAYLYSGDNEVFALPNGQGFMSMVIPSVCDSDIKLKTNEEKEMYIRIQEEYTGIPLPDMDEEINQIAREEKAVYPEGYNARNFFEYEWEVEDETIARIENLEVDNSKDQDWNILGSKAKIIPLKAGETQIHCTITTLDGEQRIVKTIHLKVENGSTVVLESIEITAPTKVNYNVGDELDLAGLKVTAKYSDESTKELTSEEYTVSMQNGSILNQVGEQEITVTYQGKTKSFKINVQEKVEPEEKLRIEITETDYIQTQEEDKIYVEGIQPETEYSTIMQKIQTNGEIKIYDKNNEEVKEEEIKIATGMKLVITKGEETKEFTLVVRGDTNGDSTANFTDMLKINKHRLKKVLLEGANLKAGDINGDGVANFTDMLKINKFRLKKVTKLQ